MGESEEGKHGDGGRGLSQWENSARTRGNSLQL